MVVYCIGDVVIHVEQVFHYKEQGRQNPFPELLRLPRVVHPQIYWLVFSKAEEAKIPSATTLSVSTNIHIRLHRI